MTSLTCVQKSLVGKRAPAPCDTRFRKAGISKKPSARMLAARRINAECISDRFCRYAQNRPFAMSEFRQECEMP